MISIEHGLAVIHNSSGQVWPNNSTNTEFVNSAMKLEVPLVFAEDSYLVSG